MRHNPAILSGLQTTTVVFLAISLGTITNQMIIYNQYDDSLIDYVSLIVFKLVVETAILRIIVPIIFVLKKSSFRRSMKSAIEDGFNIKLSEKT